MASTGTSGRDCECNCTCSYEKTEKLPRLSLMNISPHLPSYMIDLYDQERLLKLHKPNGCSPVIVDVFPRTAYPGSLHVIIGHGFAPHRELNEVSIGRQKAFVVTAENHRLVVISSAQATRGGISVKNSYGQGFAGIQFRPLSVSIDSQPSWPFSFEGSGNGEVQSLREKLPSVGTANILAVCCYPTDTVPAKPADAKAVVVENCSKVSKYYAQASFGALTVKTEVSDFFALGDKIDAYYLKESTDPGYPNFRSDVLPQLYAEAANIANGQGYDLNKYDVLLIVVHLGTFVRAWGGGIIGPNISFPGSKTVKAINITLDHSLGTITLGYDAEWGRYAHEFGHNIVEPGAVLPEDLYAADAGSNADFSGAEFDLMGDHDIVPLFSGYNIDSLGWFDKANVSVLSWKPSPFSGVFDIVAHGLTQNTDSSRVHLVKIQVSAGLEYFVEVRQKPGTTDQVFDGSLPVPAGKDGGVVVTRSISGVLNNNQHIRLVTLLQSKTTTLVNGDVATDPLRTIRITVVDDNIQATPLVCRVRIEWAQPIDPTPGGNMDLYIRPWGKGYASPDIWIDRPPYGTYDNHDASNNPINGGDAPRLGDVNHFAARVHNNGTKDAEDVITSLYVNTPPGIGDSGNWTPLKTVLTPTIAAGSSEVVMADWDPNLDQHTCLRVAIEPQKGEVSVSNNQAQQNVFRFEPPSNPIPAPVELALAVRNPLDRHTLVFLTLTNVPQGYYVYFPHQFVYLEARAEKFLDLIVAPLRELDVKNVSTADIRVTGYIPWPYTQNLSSNNLPPSSMIREIGGIQASISPHVEGVITLSPEFETGDWIVTRGGYIIPPVPDQAVRVEMAGKSSEFADLLTDEHGGFKFTFSLIGQFPTVRYVTFQAYIDRASVVAPCFSNIIHMSIT